MSDTKKDYDKLKGLINGHQIGTLSSDILLESVQQYTLSQLGNLTDIRHVLHDGCDIRKPNSKEMAFLGQVMSLSKQVVNGYKTMNSVVVDTDNQGVSLLFHEVYSNKMPNYIGQTTINDAELRSALSNEQQQMILENSYINTTVLFKKSLKTSSELLKSTNSKLVVNHIFDREFDDEQIFEYIDTDLQDTFVARLKNSRNSHLAFNPLTPTGKLSKRTLPYKLIDKTYSNSSTYKIERIVIKGTKYEDVEAQIDWEIVKIGQKSYTAVRITLLKGGKTIFAQPMLLLTNQKVNSPQAAKSIYIAYLLRAKIEIVFKFLKQNLGWEAFQVRDFNSIKNLLALAFFLVGFFPELENELKSHPLAIHLCKLAKSKGKITLHFLLNGLEMLVNFQQVNDWMQQNNITKDDIDVFLADLGFK